MQRVENLTNAISSLIAQFSDIHQKAKELGIFTNDRELLQCLRCGLTEDVACDGRLTTVQSVDGPFNDTALRFQEIDSIHFSCPQCHCILFVTEKEEGNGG